MDTVIVNVIVIAILAAIVGGIVWYLIRAKRNGATCIGCSESKKCNGKCSACAHAEAEKKNKKA